MRKTLLMALAAAALLAGGMPGNRAEAMPPAAHGAAAGDTAVVRRVTNVCGTNGCVRVETTRLRKHQLRHH